MVRFRVTQRARTGRADAQYLVVDSDDEQRPVAEFDDRSAAQAHADKLNQGPLDWDEQEAWQDEWDDDDDRGDT